MGFQVQAGSRFIIGSVTNLDSSRWTIVSKQAQGELVTLNMVNYDSNVFEFDFIPDVFELYDDLELFDELELFSS